MCDSSLMLQGREWAEYVMCTTVHILRWISRVEMATWGKGEYEVRSVDVVRFRWSLSDGAHKGPCPAIGHQGKHFGSFGVWASFWSTLRRSLGFWEQPFWVRVEVLAWGRGVCTYVSIVYCTDFWVEIKVFFGHPSGEGL